jgi:hypothetical protein
MLVVVLTIFGNACDDIIESTADYGRNDCLIVENFDWLRMYIRLVVIIMILSLKMAK